ncbi:hypothetical protein USDA257_c13570 [Sinorhizobium fredii USDA 257]|uniref:Uncharacterized protein n=1 Tax=Sinorhizobium fredii (strain USDA 257) TaxID=1185652 RepID=I3X242_SINF2|nr:hypothetical protein USDA257_c13570 [Sinorhizobium fredii USDA 257]
MKSDIGNFGCGFRPVEFLIRFYLVMARAAPSHLRKTALI